MVFITLGTAVSYEAEVETTVTPGAMLGTQAGNQSSEKNDKFEQSLSLEAMEHYAEGEFFPTLECHG